ncbi:Protein of unknown function DUF1761 [Rhabdaerophilaceae bacterium]
MTILLIVGAAIASWLFGAVYYGILGKSWMNASGFNPEQREKIEAGPKANPLPFIVSFVAELVMALVLALVLRNLGADGVPGALVVAATLWIGLVVTTGATNNAYSMRPAALTVIDSGHWLGVLLVQALVLSALG